MAEHYFTTMDREEQLHQLIAALSRLIEHLQRESLLSSSAALYHNGCTAVDAKAFGARLDVLRAELGLKVRTKGQDVFFVDLKLAS